MKEYPLHLLGLFENAHKIPLKKTPYLRAVIQENNMIVGRFLDRGLVTKDQIVKIFGDKKFRMEFAEIAIMLQHCTTGEAESVYEDVSRSPEIFCAWLMYQNEFLSDFTQLNLEPNSERYQKYLDFIGQSTYEELL